MASVIARTALSRSARFVASARRHLRVRRHYHRGRDRRTQRRQDVPHLGDLLGRCPRHVQRHHGRRRQPPRVRLRRAGNGRRRQPERAGLGQRQPRPLAEGQLVACPLQGALTLVASAPCIGSFACVTRAPPLSHSAASSEPGAVRRELCGFRWCASPSAGAPRTRRRRWAQRWQAATGRAHRPARRGHRGCRNATPAET